jgi:hypothetical protein
MESNNNNIATTGGLVINFLPQEQVIVAAATRSYITEKDFKEAFEKTLDFLKTTTVTTFIFDKTELNTFHQPSMEWYHLEWKPQAAASGLTHHFKILPNSVTFKTSVEIGRRKIFGQIDETHPLHKISITYTDTVEEALSKAAALV